MVSIIILEALAAEGEIWDWTRLERREEMGERRRIKARKHTTKNAECNDTRNRRRKEEEREEEKANRSTKKDGKGRREGGLGKRDR